MAYRLPLSQYGPITQQRCWVHKTANILDKRPELQGFELIQTKGKLPALTVALTQLIKNAAVAIILAPIAHQIARAGHADPSLSWWHWPFAFQRRFVRPLPTRPR